MSVWIPVAFYCLVNQQCAFSNGNLSISVEQCDTQNTAATRALKADPDVSAFQVTCIEITPKHSDSL